MDKGKRNASPNPKTRFPWNLEDETSTLTEESNSSTSALSSRYSSRTGSYSAEEIRAAETLVMMATSKVSDKITTPRMNHCSVGSSSSVEYGVQERGPWYPTIDSDDERFKLSSKRSVLRSYKCSICGLVFKRGQGIGVHMRNHRALQSNAIRFNPLEKYLTWNALT